MNSLYGIVPIQEDESGLSSIIPTYLLNLSRRLARGHLGRQVVISVSTMWDKWTIFRHSDRASPYVCGQNSIVFYSRHSCLNMKLGAKHLNLFAVFQPRDYRDARPG